MQEVIRNIAYAPHGLRGQGDLFLPAGEPTGTPVLMIHGGGWNALTKESIEPLARAFVRHGRAVFNINYRLLDNAPWPGCLEDCVAAAEFMLAGRLAKQGVEAPEKLIVCGASAGGHLALMTGLKLPADRVEFIVDLCGPTHMNFPDGSSEGRFATGDFLEKFLGRPGPATEADIQSTSPVLLARPDAPALFCIHSRNDRLVPINHSQNAVAAWRLVGAPAELIDFDGPGDSHGIWDSEDRATREPVKEVLAAVADICRRSQFHATNKS